MRLLRSGLKVGVGSGGRRFGNDGEGIIIAEGNRTGAAAEEEREEVES